MDKDNNSNVENISQAEDCGNFNAIFDKLF